MALELGGFGKRTGLAGPLSLSPSRWNPKARFPDRQHGSATVRPFRWCQQPAHGRRPVYLAPRQTGMIHFPWTLVLSQC